MSPETYDAMLAAMRRELDRKDATLRAERARRIAAEVRLDSLAGAMSEVHTALASLVFGGVRKRAVLERIQALLTRTQERMRRPAMVHDDVTEVTRV